jgi:hypothetical protein
MNRSHRVLGDRLGRFGTIRQARRVSEIQIVGVGNQAEKFFEDCKSPESGVKNAYARSPGSHVFGIAIIRYPLQRCLPNGAILSPGLGLTPFLSLDIHPFVTLL